MKNNSEILSGWKLHYEEVSNNVYRFEMEDDSGRQVGCTDQDFNRGLETCFSYALDIEKQTKINFNKFILSLFCYKLKKDKIVNNTGSWTLKKNNNRIYLDSSKFALKFQTQTADQNWIDISSINLNDLTYDYLKDMLEKFV